MSNPLPYSDIRILDFTQFQQGPIGTQFLGDFGAEIIKIERPGGGDGFRGGTRPEAKINGTPYYGTAFVACNRNKKSLAIDLKSPHAKAIIHDLVKVSDVVAANFRPGVMEKLGFGYDVLSAINPRIICAYATGYGLDGPDRDTLGQDMMAQCRAGLVRGTPPKTIGFNLVDQFGGLMLAQGIMLALAAREKSGRGQIVDTCLLNTALVADTLGATSFLNSRTDRSTPTSPKMPNPTYALYQGRDGRWVHIIDAFRDQPLRRQCRALGLPESVADDPRFANVHTLSPETYGALHGLLAGAIAQFTPEEVVARFKTEDMMAVVINTHADAFADPQVQHNGMVLEATHPVAGGMKVLGFPIKLSDTPAQLQLAPPLLGEHTSELLSTLLGYDQDRLASLHDAGVIA